MKIRVPELEDGLALEPSLAHEQAVYDARLVVFPPSLLCGLYDFPGNDWAVCLGNPLFIELARDHLFDLVLEP